MKRKFHESSESSATIGRSAVGTSSPISCVVGIDFGTARSGYAFAFKTNDDSQGQFKAFGSKALNMYYENESDDLLFQRFKMNLHHQNSGNPQATALNGNKMSLLDVISKSLEYIKKDALAAINQAKVADLKLEEIQWVLTVPAIWSDSAKAAMRRAAFKAGLIAHENSDLLELALEPEAACIACEGESANLKRRDTFMVLDCGGGTVDITMHRVAEKLPQLQLDEICPPSGGPWGSTFVDEEFERFIEKILGAEAFRRFKPSPQWVELMRTWETVKLSYDPSEDTGDSLTKYINISPALEVVENPNIKEMVDAYNRSHGTALGYRGRSSLSLPTAMIQNFFRTVVSKIVFHVKELLAENDVKYIFLVGGFAESKMLHHRIRNEFEKDGRRVVMPLRPGLAVVKGAVMVGLGASKRFASRIARHTYGVAVAFQYDPSNPDHQGRSTYTQFKSGKLVTYVGGAFSAIVKQGTRVALDEIHKGGILYCEADGTTTARIDLYSATNADAKWISQDGMALVGSITIPSKAGDKLSVDLCFGKTEIKASVNNKTSSTATPLTIQYDFSKL